MKNYTIIDSETDSESPMIGTITGMRGKQDIEAFKLRFIDAAGEHFDADDIHYLEFPDIFDGGPFWDITLTINDLAYPVRIFETWMY